MDRWEYLYIVADNDYNSKAGWTQELWIFRPDDPDVEARNTYQLSEVLNEFGQQGWELVGHEVLGSLALQEYGTAEDWHPARSFSRRRAFIFKRRLP